MDCTDPKLGANEISTFYQNLYSSFFSITDSELFLNQIKDFVPQIDSSFMEECDNHVMGTILTDASCRIVIDPHRIQSIFKHVCTKKSTGPDGISALLLKACAEELTPVWCPIFQRSVDSHTVPALWKKSTIVPVAKKRCPADNNDFRRVALTSIVMKSFEKYMLSMLKAEVNLALDPYQFAYRQGRGTDDAINSITHFTVEHLECPNAYAWILFIGFSSAFNTLQRHLLISKLRQMSVNPFLIK